MIDGCSYSGLGVHIENLSQADRANYPKVRLLFNFEMILVSRNC